MKPLTESWRYFALRIAQSTHMTIASFINYISLEKLVVSNHAPPIATPAIESSENRPYPSRYLN